MRKSLVKFLFGFSADDFSNIRKETESLNRKFQDQQANLDTTLERLTRINDLGDASFNILKAQRDDSRLNRHSLWSVRETRAYKKAFVTKNPLVTVRIATYNNADKLVDVALKSVLNQTYSNIEVIVIGDHCTDDTEQRIRDLNDSRVTFINLPYRSIYPEDQYNRWLVAGSPGMNLGAYLAQGEWIAPLDDDDEFSADHIEKLLKIAQSEKAEFAYGAILQKNATTGEEKVLYSEMPKFGEFSFQSVMYLKQISFFEYDQQSWVVGEPGDWNLCRRMLEAGVRIASTNDIVTTIHMIPKNRN